MLLCGIPKVRAIFRKLQATFKICNKPFTMSRNLCNPNPIYLISFYLKHFGKFWIVKTGRERDTDKNIFAIESVFFKSKRDLI